MTNMNTRAVLNYLKPSAIVYQILVSNNKSALLSRPTHALRNASRALRCLLRLLTTSEPDKDRQTGASSSI